MFPAQFSRRDFLRTALGSTAAVSLPLWFLEHGRAYAAESETKSPNARPRIALIGCGGQGIGIAKHARAFADVVALCDVDKKRAEAAAAQFEGASVFHDYWQVLELLASMRSSMPRRIIGTPSSYRRDEGWS
jgi:threonine dehydrogenase-like Zn-dependent dehydrogenase